MEKKQVQELIDAKSDRITQTEVKGVLYMWNFGFQPVWNMQIRPRPCGCRESVWNEEDSSLPRLCRASAEKMADSTWLLTLMT